MEPIAITGIGCKLPGGVASPDQLWAHLIAGTDLITETPPDRWNADTHFHPNRGAPGRTYARWGGYVTDPAGFDAAFFGLTPREAAHMDPQQRWLLETAWEALEDAGIPPATLAGTRAGVFVGISSCDYGDIQKRGPFQVDMHTTSGSALSIASNRISYLLDLRGPSLSVDTACSSSLVALDLACQSIWRGEVPLALLGGANAILGPDVTVSFAKGGFLSPTGRCRAFAAAADGFVRAEGAAVVVLKPLSQAVADGDRVYAVIRATLTNQDGRTGGLTVPSAEQQQAMLEETYRRAEVNPADVSYVEAHGTGTAVGDPLEATALGRALGTHRKVSDPLWIGSVKSNLGHLEPASGVVGLVKLALAMHHRTIPANLHCQTPNPRIPFDEYHLRVPTTAMPWKGNTPDGFLYGGVNSFGFGGTNAHAVLASALSHAVVHRETSGPQVWTVSARSSGALAVAARNDAEFIESNSEQFGTLAAAVRERRSHHSSRVAVVADNAAEAAERLRGVATGTSPAGAFTGHATAHAPPVAIVFSGQGTQWPGMARDLFQSNPRFRETCEELDAIMRPAWGRSLIEEVLRGDETVYQSDIGQPVLFAVQIGVYRLFRDWGIAPALVMGHSFGEVAAAHASGALTLAAAAQVIVERAKALELTRDAGVMAAVGVSEEEIEPLLKQFRGRLSIAAFNSAIDLTIAGDSEAVGAAVEVIAAKGRFARLLPFPYAFHSPAVESCREVFTRAIAGLPATRPEIPFVSSVIGRELTDIIPDERYWWRNLRQPVRFADAIARAAELGAKVFLEVGPHPGLVRYVKQVLGTDSDAIVLGSLRRNESGPHCLAESLSALHVTGVDVAWRQFSASRIGHVAFPKYPWQRQQFWEESTESRHHRLAGPTHPLLGVREVGSGKRWETCLSAEVHPFLADHGFRGRAVFPAAGHIELMLSAAADGSFADPVGLADINFDHILWADESHLVQTAFDPISRRLTVSAQPVHDSGRGWEVCSRSVRWAADATGGGSTPRGAEVPPEAKEVSVEEFYTRFHRAGHHYGPLFRSVQRMWISRNEVWAEVALDSSLSAAAQRFYLHPAILDGVFQAVLAATPVDEEREAMFLPVRVERIEWRRRGGSRVVCHVHNVHIQDVRWFADIDVFTPEGELVATLTGCCCVKKPQEAHLTRSETKLYREEWTPTLLGTETAAPPSAWLVIDPSGSAGKLVSALAEGGAWVGHQVSSRKNLIGEFLARAGESGAVMVWAPGLAQSKEPSVEGVLNAIDPLLNVAQALSAADATCTLWLATSGATFGHDGNSPDLRTAPTAGMLRTIATELPKVMCRLLDLDPAQPGEYIERALAELQSTSTEDEVAYRGGERFACRMHGVGPDALALRALPATQSANAAYELRTTEPGSLDGLAWVAVEEKSLASHEIEIEVRAVGLNFRDVLKALDIYPLAATEARSFGDECSGVVRRVGTSVAEFRPGDEVIAIAAHGFGNRVRVAAVLAAKKPVNLTFEQAATIPIAFLTADYCLTDVARLDRGESVLIHAAAGGVGQAAVQIARRIGAEVFATASPEKHNFLRSQGVRHVFHSRNLSFADGVRAASDGRGVDVALNSLAGEFIPRTLELLAPGGRFVEIGKKDIFQNSVLDLNPFRNGVSFSAVDLSRVIAAKPEWLGRRLRALLELFARGEYTPLAATAFTADKVTDAFRLMAQGKHRGKLVVAPGAASKVLAHERPVVRADASYLITGGLSGLGLRTAEWLAEQGARWLVLTGRSGAKTPAAKEVVAALGARGVHVEVVACDVADANAMRRLVHTREGARPPLRGVVHSAMVLHDEPLSRVSRATLEKVLAPKVAGAWNLHLATQDVPLDWFVMYSSVATLVGPVAQASYVAANRFLDALAWHRRAEGLPATALNWGALAEIGVVADNAALASYLESVGVGLIPPDEVFRVLKFVLRRDVTTLSAARIDWAKFRAGNPTAQRSKRLSPVLEQKAGADAGTGGDSDALRTLLAASPDDREALLVSHLRRALAAVLLADETSLDSTAPLTSFGVDSLMAFEFKLRIDRDFKTNVPIDKLSAGTTLNELAAILLKQLTVAPSDENAPAAAPAEVPAPVIAPAVPAEVVSDEGFLRVLTRTGAGSMLDNLTFDSAALLYVPDRVNTVGGVEDSQLAHVFGDEPFISHLYELPFGRIAVITLPIRGKEMFGSPRVPGLVRKAGEMARRRGAKVISLTGLIPSATEYGHSVREWFGDAGPRVTTGHATTTAAVILNLQNMLEQTGRYARGEHLAVLGLGSIGQSCLALMLDVLPHPRALTLCDVFSKQDEVKAVARRLRERHDYRGTLRVLTSDRRLPDGLYEASTILTAVSVPDVIDVNRLRPGTIIVDDSYPPGFPLGEAIRRSETEADLFFSNAGMTRLSEPIRETVFLPPGAESVVTRLGVDAFRRELARDPRELTACILSSLLTDRHEGFRATLGLADRADLRSHYNGLLRLGITAARPQCGTYFVPDDVLHRFRDKFPGSGDEKRERSPV